MRVPHEAEALAEPTERLGGILLGPEVGHAVLGGDRRVMHTKHRLGDRERRRQRADEGERVGRHGAPRERDARAGDGIPALGDLGMEERVLVVAANAEAAVRTDERQALGRLGAVAHDVAEAEDRIDIADLAVTQDLLERNAVAMDVGDDRKSWHADPQLGLVPAGCPRSARRPIG